MQNKGLIKFFAIALGLLSIYNLSFTYFTKNVEDKAKSYAESIISTDSKDVNASKQRDSLTTTYLDSIANKKEIFFNQFTYSDVKKNEMNLGLDLKGGINAILEVSVRDILVGLSQKSQNLKFNKALDNATEAQNASDDTYLNLFFEAFDALDGPEKLSDPTIFGNKTLRDKINRNIAESQVKDEIAREVSNNISTAFEVLRSRIDQFGVSQPKIQRIGQSGKILIELPGAKDIDRIEKLITGTAELQFWVAHTNLEVQNFLISANSKISELLNEEAPEEAIKDVAEVKKDSTTTSQLEDLLSSETDEIDQAKNNRLFSIFAPNFAQNAQQRSSVIGQASLKDVDKINSYLNRREVRALLSEELKYVKFLWDSKPAPGTEVVSLYAIKSNRTDTPPIEGDVIYDAYHTFDQLGKVQVSMSMKQKASKEWAKLTERHLNDFVAVVLDDKVYSAPIIQVVIPNGQTSISGGAMTIVEAQDLANVLKAGKLPARATIIQKAVVGPSLGKESIAKSYNSFFLALALIFLWMLFYYGKAGAYADIALAINILFIFGILASFKAVLTLSGIAGIILTIGMSVDANVIIFERIKEELNKGKSVGDAISTGFSIRGALSAIVDANVTTFLTGAILFVFGTGPIKGFATTLMIGIITSLFSAVAITRLFINWHVSRGNDLTFNTNITKNWFKNIDVKFLAKRKVAYIFSGVLIVVGAISLATNGLNYGVDFEGGRSYVVKFDKPMNANEVSSKLKEAFGDQPEVKTYGENNKLKITTDYLITDKSPDTDEKVRKTLFDNLVNYLPAGTSYETFKGGQDDQTIGIESNIKVDGTIADDIKKAAGWSIAASLLFVFLYILLRFKKWQFSLGAVVAVFHDVLIVLAIFSLTHNLMPFDMEIGESFIAAILTVVGYSLNDTVVIFDRIREYANEHSNWKYMDIVDKALSSTLGRTINTSLTTLVTLLAIFTFGGDSIKGFMFAMIIGVLVGTYSSLFIASPLMYDASKKLNKKNTAEDNKELS